MLNYLRFGLNAHERKQIRVNVLLLATPLFTLLMDVKKVPQAQLMESILRTFQAIENMAADRRALAYTKHVAKRYVLEPILVVCDREIKGINENLRIILQ
jgi:hypothetical protein